MSAPVDEVEDKAEKVVKQGELKAEDEAEKAKDAVKKVAPVKDAGKSG